MWQMNVRMETNGEFGNAPVKWKTSFLAPKFRCITYFTRISKLCFAQLYNFGHLKCVNFAFLVKFDPLKNNPILQIQSPSCVIYKPGQLKFKLNNFNEGGI